jgi:hypothetical protein
MRCVEHFVEKVLVWEWQMLAVGWSGATGSECLLFQWWWEWMMAPSVQLHMCAKTAGILRDTIHSQESVMYATITAFSHKKGITDHEVPILVLCGN